MRALFLEVIRSALNIFICVFILKAGIDLESSYLIIASLLMFWSKIIAVTERRVTWEATKKKSFYVEKFRESENLDSSLNYIKRG